MVTRRGPDRALRALAAAALSVAALLGGAAHAQLAPIDPDWKEEQAPPPPAFNKDRAIRIEMPVYMELNFGVDPETIVVGADGIVRYVMVASSRSGIVNAMYEALRCSTGEMRTYARYVSSGWENSADQEWRSLQDNRARHAMAFAKQGACDGRFPRRTPQDIARALRNPNYTNY